MRQEDARVNEEDLIGPRGGYVKSYGCQMNAYDSSRIAGLLEEAGYSARENAGDAEVIVLNTCHIREKASDKVFSELGQIRQLKHERAGRGQRTIVGVAGCVAQAEGAEILRREAAVDFVVGPQSYHRLHEALRNANAGERTLLVNFETEEKFQNLKRRPVFSPTRVSAFVTAQEGCDKFCSFCVVPYTRGAEISRAAHDIVAEADELARNGTRDISLLGQNVNAYLWNGPDREWTLAGLFERLSQIPGLHRLRYTTSHPRDMRNDLIVAHRELPKVMPYLHLPVQSGSDAILHAMNRKHTARDYVATIERVRAARPDIAISSDFIVGFPGETEADFQSTLRLVREVGFASAFSFKYSPRPGTPSADWADHVPEEIKKRRLQELQELLEAQRQSFNAAYIGGKLDVLFEKQGRHPGQIVGRTPYMQSVQVDAPESLIGQNREVIIERLGSNSLFGRMSDQPEGA